MSETSVPQPIEERIAPLRRLFHKASWLSFRLLLLGLFTGVARQGIVRASLLSSTPYNWRRIHDFVRRNRWSHQGLIAANCQRTLDQLYPEGLPERLVWIADTSTTDKPSARRIDGIRIHKRSNTRFGQRNTHKGHGWLFLSLARRVRSYQHRSLMIGALLWTKRSSPTELLPRLLNHARLPKKVKHLVVVDRGFGSIKLTKALNPKAVDVLVRMKKDERIYPSELPPRTGKKGRPLVWGESWQVSQYSKWGTYQKVRTRVDGRLKWVRVWSGLFRRYGLETAVRVYRIELKRGKELYLQSSDLSLSCADAVWYYLGRQSIEGAIEETKELGLGDYRGRKIKGVRRWGTLVCVAQNLLQSVALTEGKEEELPKLEWPWYGQEKTPGAIQRRLTTQLIQEGLFQGFSATLGDNSRKGENRQSGKI